MKPSARRAPVHAAGRRPTRRQLVLSAAGITALTACDPRADDDEEDPEMTSTSACHPAAEAPARESAYGAFQIASDRLVSPLGLAISPDSSLVAAGLEKTAPRSRSVEDWGTAIWDTASGDLITVTGNHRRGPLAWHPSGDLIAAAGRSQIDVMNRDGTLQWTLSGHSLGPHEDRMITDLAFSPDGDVLASTSTDRTVRLWRIREDSCEATDVISLEDLMPSSHSFSPDGTQLAVAGATGPVQIWSVDDSELVRTVETPQGSALGVGHLSDGSVAISSYQPATLAVVDPSGAVRSRPALAAQRPYGLSVSADDVIAVSDESRSIVTTWDPTSGTHQDLPPAQGTAQCAQWSHDGTALYAVSTPVGIMRWDGTQWSALQMP